MPAHEPCGASSILATATTSGRMLMDQTAAFGARRLCVRLAPLGPIHSGEANVGRQRVLAP